MTSRRNFIKIAGLSAIGSTFLPDYFHLAFAEAVKNLPKSKKPKSLVFIFMRGAADGLSLVPPLKDSHYNSEMRPSLFMGPQVALNLDGFFGLHPALSDLMPLWNQKKLAFIHQTGSPTHTRSHFDAQDYIESGTPNKKSTEDGFLDRALAELTSKSSPLRAVALQSNLPRSLWGTHGSFAMGSLNDLKNSKGLGNIAYGKNFESMYESALDEALKGTSQKTFEAFDMVQNLPKASTETKYPKSALGNYLKDIARLIHGNVNLELAVTECGGWDTHKGQGNEKGLIATKLKDFGESISAFTEDLGPLLEDVCIVAMTEFGRTVKENGNQGTDHGHGSVMMVLGGQIKGKQVISHWKDLKKENLFEGRDLPVTIDYRDVWKEILTSQLKIKDTKNVFPDYKPGKSLGLFTS